MPNLRKAIRRCSVRRTSAESNPTVFKLISFPGLDLKPFIPSVKIIEVEGLDSKRWTFNVASMIQTIVFEQS